MNPAPTLADIGWYFFSVSLIAIGGANAILPEIHRQLVDVHGWISSTDFVALNALAQAAPGPNVLVVSLLGWKLAGLPGALVATMGMCLPPVLLTYYFSDFWRRFRHAHWHTAVQAGLGSVTIGLILASGYVLTRAADHDWMAYGMTGLTALLMMKTKIHPFWLLGLAGLLGFLGVL